MKKLSAIFLGLVLLVGTAVSAAVVTENRPLDPVSAEIATLLENPTFDVYKEMNALVSFVVNRDNELEILSVDANSGKILNFVTDRLSHQKLNATLVQGKEYTIPIKIQS
jgi:hypothetical protein